MRQISRCRRWLCKHWYSCLVSDKSFGKSKKSFILTKKFTQKRHQNLILRKLIRKQLFFILTVGLLISSIRCQDFNSHRDLQILLSLLKQIRGIFMPLDRVNIDDEILDHVHESIYLQPIYSQLTQDKLTTKTSMKTF
jgi:hypothetical protein